MWFALTQIQAVHEEACQQEELDQRQAKLISALQCFSHLEAPPLLPPPRKRRQPKKKPKEPAKPKPKRPKKTPKVSHTYGSLAMARYGSPPVAEDESNSAIQKHITDYIELGLRFQQPAENIAGLMAKSLVDKHDYAQALSRLRLRFPRLHPKYKRSLRLITLRMLGVDEPPVLQVVTRINHEDSRYPVGQLFAPMTDSPSLWDQASQGPPLSEDDILWLYDLEDNDSSGSEDSEYSAELADGGVVILTQEGDILHVLDSEDEPEPLKFSKDPGFSPLVSFQVPLAPKPNQVPIELIPSTHDPSHQVEPTITSTTTVPPSLSTNTPLNAQTQPPTIDTPHTPIRDPQPPPLPELASLRPAAPTLDYVPQIDVPESSNLDRIAGSLQSHPDADIAFIESQGTEVETVYSTAREQWLLSQATTNPKREPEVQVPLSSPMDGSPATNQFKSPSKSPFKVYPFNFLQTSTQLELSPIKGCGSPFKATSTQLSPFKATNTQLSPFKDNTRLSPFKMGPTRLSPTKPKTSSVHSSQQTIPLGIFVFPSSLDPSTTLPIVTQMAALGFTPGQWTANGAQFRCIPRAIDEDEEVPDSEDECPVIIEIGRNLVQVPLSQ